MIKVNIEQGSDAWFDYRAGRITGTRFASLIAGESTKTYKDLVAEVAMELITGEQESGGYVSPQMERGKELEPEAAFNFAEFTGIEVEQIGFVLTDEDDWRHDWVGVSPDRLTENGGLLEIKCPMAKTHISYIFNGKVPAEYMPQVQGQLYVSGLPFAYFVSYYPNSKLFIAECKPDQKIFTTFDERLRGFIEDVKEMIKKYEQ